MQPTRPLSAAFYELFKDSGFSMAGAIAFAFVLSIFPFCIFLAALAGMIGGRPLAVEAVHQISMMAPPRIAETLAPEIEAVMSQTRYGLLTLGGVTALFFATSAIESLRAALNVAYRVKETRPFYWCYGQSMLFVFISAMGFLAVTAGIVIGPSYGHKLGPGAVRWLLDQSWSTAFIRNGLVGVVIALQLLAYHAWLVAGRRRLTEILPGVLVSMILGILAAQAFSYYLNFNDYTKFYAGLSQVAAALVFFQLTGIVIIVGAEFNRALGEIRAGRVSR